MKLLKIMTRKCLTSSDRAEFYSPFIDSFQIELQRHLAEWHLGEEAFDCRGILRWCIHRHFEMPFGVVFNKTILNYM